MAVEYLGLSEINGPLVVLEGVQNAAYDEIVEMTVAGNTKKIGRIIEIYGDKAIIQVFEGTDGMALRNTHTRLTGYPMEIAVSEEMLGRTFNGIGEPIDGLGEHYFRMCVWISKRTALKSRFQRISQKLHPHRHLRH